VLGSCSSSGPWFTSSCLLLSWPSWHGHTQSSGVAPS